MTLYDMGLEYADTAAALRERIRQVEQLREQETDDSRILLLDHRLRLLRSMWRDTRAVAIHLEHYYEKGTSRNANYLL